MRRTGALLAALGMAIAPWVIAAGPAHAQEARPEPVEVVEPEWSTMAVKHWMYTDDNGSGGKVDFMPYGDYVRLCDRRADGYRAVLNVRNVTKNRFEYKIQAIGNGACTTVRASGGQPWNMAEGHCFQFHIYLYSADTGDAKGDDWAYWRNDNKNKRWCS